MSDARSGYAVPRHGGDRGRDPADPPGPRRGPGAAFLGLVPELAVATVAATAFGWGLEGATAWRDEQVTLTVATRPVASIIALTREQDLVHLAYYLLVHPVLAFWPSVTALRVVSVLGVVAAAVVLVRIGRALAGWRVGLAAGLLLAASPAASRYAQEARSYALVALLSALATLALLRAIGRTVARERATLRWAGYGTLLVLIGIANMLGLLVVLGHAVYILGYVLTARSGRGRAVLMRWLAAGTLAAAALSPFAVLAWGEVHQVAWITRPETSRLAGIAALVWTPTWAAWSAIAVAMVVVMFRGGAGGGRALLLGLGWGLLPPLALWALSQVHPLYQENYLFPDAAGLALAVAALAGERRMPPAGVVAGLPQIPAQVSDVVAAVAAADGPRALVVPPPRPDQAPTTPPTEPGEPGEPEEPTEREERAEPEEPEKPAEPEEPTEREERAEPEEPEKPREAAGKATRRRARVRIAAAAVASVVPAAALGAAGLPQQAVYRSPIGHGEDIPAVVRELSTESRAGDAVLFLPYWLRLLVMGQPLPSTVEDVALAQTGLESNTITGTEVDPDEVRRRLQGRCRIWVVIQTGAFAGWGPTDAAEVDLLRSGYEQVGKDSKQAFDVLLFRSRSPECAARG